MNKDTLELIRAITADKEVVQEITKAILALGPEISPIFRDINSFWTEETMRRFDYFKHHGCTKEEAMLLTINTNAAIERAILNWTGNKGEAAK